jgi:hypothetical protein
MDILDEFNTLVENSNVPPINYNDWNDINVVRPCIVMLVVIDLVSSNAIAYLELDTVNDKPKWVLYDGGEVEYSVVRYWKPLFNDYMKCVEYGERLKAKHEKNNRTK